MSMRVETRRDDNGRLLNLTIYKGTAKKVQLQFDFAQDEFIDTIKFIGRKEDLPSASEIVALISAKFMERVQTLGNIEDALPAGTNSIGQVTANAGTNLNTSLLALEAGGNLATIAGKDFATQTTLALIKAKTDNLDVLLSTRALEAGGNLAALVAKDYATQTTLALLKTRADLLATEATLGTVHGHVDSIDGKITACNTGAVAGSLTQSTKHDSKVYAPAIFDAAASGALIASAAGKVTKLHALAIQAQGTVIVNLNNGVGGASLMEWSFQAREGAVLPLASGPAYWAVTSVDTSLYVTLSAAVQVTITAVVSRDDAS